MFTTSDGQFGPEYTITSSALQKFRSRARKGLRTWDRDQRQAYGAAVEQAVLSALRSQCKRHGEVMPAPRCASGTWHTTGEEIEAAIRSRQNAALLAYPAKVRRERTPEQWQALYAETMEAKRAHKPKRSRRAA
jgi:hypothetical protein